MLTGPRSSSSPYRRPPRSASRLFLRLVGPLFHKGPFCLFHSKAKKPLGSPGVFKTERNQTNDLPRSIRSPFWSKNIFFCNSLGVDSHLSFSITFYPTFHLNPAFFGPARCDFLIVSSVFINLQPAYFSSTHNLNQ